MLYRIVSGNIVLDPRGSQDHMVFLSPVLDHSSSGKSSSSSLNLSLKIDCNFEMM